MSGSKRIPAIVLTTDKYRPFTENMIAAYQEMWPSNPFVFHIPYQENDVLGEAVLDARVEFVRTKKNIAPTVLKLLEAFDPDDLVYWCIDDKFPISIDAKRATVFFEGVFRNGPPSRVDGVALTRDRSLIAWPGIGRERFKLGGLSLYSVRSPKNFWFHRLVKVHVLRAFFESLPPVSVAKEMDSWVRTLGVPSAQFVARRGLLVLGESTSRGVPTIQSRQACAARGILIPSGFSKELVDISPIGQLSLRNKTKAITHDLISLGASPCGRRL